MGKASSRKRGVASTIALSATMAGTAQRAFAHL
jgi:hypothetical protein